MNENSIEARKALEKQVAEQIWLNYFNNYLLEHKVISEREHRKMTSLILARKTSTAKKAVR